MTDTPNTSPENQEEPIRTPFEEFLYHQRRALEETGKALESLLPEGFRTHSKEATKEFTKGFRVLMDAAIDEIRKASDQAAQAKAQGKTGDDSNNNEGPSTTGKTKVRVQVD